MIVSACLPLYIYVWCPQRTQEDVGFSGTEVNKCLGAAVSFLGAELGSSGRASALTC